MYNDKTFNLEKETNTTNNLHINLTDFAKNTLKDRYLIQGETYESFFMRVAIAYSDNEAHTLKMYEYMLKQWFIPATPVLTNGGTTKHTRKKLKKSHLYPEDIIINKRGMPISCFVNEADDTLHSINSTIIENINISADGGGIGTSWSAVRSMGEKIRDNGSSGGVVPFIKIIDSVVLAISQGKTRRGAAAVYLDLSHPDIEEFLYIRKASGGDPNRKSLNVHHGVLISDKFIEHVQTNKPWDLISPKTKEVIKTISARDLLIKILTLRIETGEPYNIFIDTVNNNLPEIQKKLGLKVKTSNLCSEITLPTGKDYNNKNRTGVCCLGSVNLEHYEDFIQDDQFIINCMRFLDNVLTDFEISAPSELKNAVYSAKMERSVGLGVMGLHSFLQTKHISMESIRAKAWNKEIFKYIDEQTLRASKILAKERGACEDGKKAGIMERFSNRTAIAPTATLSIITNTSPGIEPYNKNIFMHKTVIGSSIVKNKQLEIFLQKIGRNTDEIWSSITRNEGSVQHLDFLSAEDKQVYKTAFEINQAKLIELAGDRQKYITQSQSLNLFLLPDVNRDTLLSLFFLAHNSGVKSMYYKRSLSAKRVETENHTYLDTSENNEDCESCQ